MAEVTLPSKEMEELHRRFKKGYSLQQTSRSSSHFGVLDPEGEVVRTANGRPLRIASSPSDENAHHKAERELTRAGVLREQEVKERKPADPQAKTKTAAARKASAELQRQRAAQAKELQQRLEQALASVGGFDNYGNLADIAEVGSMIAREDGEPMLTPDLMGHSIRRVKAGNPIEDRARGVWVEFAERLEAADTPSSEYFALVRKAKNIPEPDSLLPQQLQMPSGEWPFVTQLIPLNKCFVDHSYQRPGQWPWIREHSIRFDPTLVGAIDVSDRGGRYAIMDGQQRGELMRMVGKSTCWAAVYQGLDVQAEAWFFIHKNRDRKNIMSMHLFKARITGDDPDAVAISKIVSKRGYRLSLAAAGSVVRGGTDERNIASVTALELAYKLGTLDQTLAVMSQTTLGLRQGNSSQMISGLALLYEAFPHLDQPTLENVLRSRTPEWLIQKSAETMPSSGGGNTRARMMRMALMGEYNRLAGRSIAKLRLT